jgi:hypothetical protein
MKIRDERPRHNDDDRHLSGILQLAVLVPDGRGTNYTTPPTAAQPSQLTVNSKNMNQTARVAPSFLNLEISMKAESHLEIVESP